MPESQPPELKVVQSSRQIIENKLLTALEDEFTVAILATEKDLGMLIDALRHFGSHGALQIAKDYQKLREAAFGK